MKKIVKITALCLALACLMSISAFAVDVKKGIGPITNKITGITVTAGTGETGTIDDVAVTDAEKLTLTYPGAVSGAQYLVLLLSGTEGAPTESNIAYIDQAAAGDSGVSFTIYPSELKKGSYRVILTCANDQKVGINTPVATFEYKQAYKLGDVNEDDAVNSTDAQWVLQAAASLRALSPSQTLAGDVNLDEAVNSTDAQWILQATVDLRTIEG